MIRALFHFIAAVLIAFPALAAPEIGKPAPDFTGTDHLGNSVTLSSMKGSVVVLEWNNPECPFVKKHYDSGNMQKLQAFAATLGKEKSMPVKWVVVNSSATGKQGHMNQPQAAEFVSREKLAVSHYVLDAAGTIGKLYAAKTTPHMYVIDSKGTLAYMGAIDDKPSTDAKDIPGAKNYVKAALEHLAAGTAVSESSTTAYGCSIKYAD